MEAERKRQILLAALAIALGVVVYRQWPTTAPAPAPASNQRAGERSGGAPADRNRQDPVADGTIDVRLESLEADRPKPGPTDRNLFRFREKPPPPAPPPANPGANAPSPFAPPTPEPVGPPQPPPIALKFIGIVKQGADERKIAVLSDGSGPPLYGAEGDVVAGRYRILKIGEESIELAYADGRGRQTIRLTGS